MRRRRLSWFLLSVTAFALTACGSAGDVAVEDTAEPAPATPAAPEPTSAAPDSPEPAPTPGETSPEEPAGADDRAPAEPPPSGPVGEEADGDVPAPAPSPRGERPGSVDAGSTARGDAAAGPVKSEAGERAEDRAPAAPADPPAIAIERPVAGSEHGGGPVTASGQATVYEGTVLLTLVGPDGSVVEEAFTTASAGAPERGRWSHTFDTVAELPGRWQVVAAATDPSDGEGRPPARSTTAFLVGGRG